MKRVLFKGYLSPYCPYKIADIGALDDDQIIKHLYLGHAAEEGPAGYVLVADVVAEVHVHNQAEIVGSAVACMRERHTRLEGEIQSLLSLPHQKDQ